MNGTLFELQRESHFPIDAAPFTGKFQVTQADSVFGTVRTYNVTISEYQNILRAVISHSSSTIEIKYIGEKLVFQARSREPGTLCFMERIGTLAEMYYDPPGKDKMSRGFHIPPWEIVAKRVNSVKATSPTSDSLADESEGNMEAFLFNPFKRAVL